MLLPWQITAGARIYDGAAGGSTVTTDALQHFATVWVFAPKGVAGGRNETVTTEDNLTGNGNGNGNSQTGNSHTLSSYQWRGNLGLSLNPTMPGPSPESAAPPEGLVFTAHRKRKLSYSARQLVSPATEEYGDPSPISHQWLKPAGGVPAYSDDGFNGDADLQGDNSDPGDPRDGITSATGALVSASPNEPGAHQVETGGARSIRIIGPYGTPTGLIGTYTATNAYSPPDTIESNGNGGFNPGQAVGKLEGVSYFQGADTNGWQGNGVGGVASYTVTSTWSTATEQGPTVTYANPETGETGTSSATYQTQGASMEQVEVRLQTNKEVVVDKPVSRTFVLTKTTTPMEGGTTSSEFAAVLRLAISSGKLSNVCEVVSGTLPAGVTTQGGVVSMRSPAPVAGNTVSLVLLPVDIVPDWNRDGKIDTADRGKVSSEKPWRFWVNDDDDDNETDGSDIPNSAGGNGLDTKVNKLRDLNDFFPLWLDISAALNAMPETDYDYVLESDTHALQFIETDLEVSNVKKFLTGELGSTSVMDNPNAIALHSTIKSVYQQQGKLSQALLSKAKTGGKGVLLIEAFKPTQSALKLVIRKKSGGGSPAELPMPLNIQSVEKMYRHLNLLGAAGGSGGRPNEMGVPANYPDDLCNTKNFVFVHGYNVNPNQARGWAAETFKRLWWSGSKAKYVAVTWHGSETQEMTGGAATPNYYVNVDNAFSTAESLKNALAALPGEKMVAAHSLGNMVVGSALSDWNAPIDKYIAIDGAVAMESWDGGAAKSNDMVHLDWDNPQTQGTYPERLWASEWHQLWPIGDARNKLTWRERVGNHRSAQVFNFYSSGEEVLAAHPHAEMPDISDIATSGLGRYAWALGEKTKGRMHTDLVMGSHSGGWGFSSAYDTTKDAQGNPVYPLTLPDPAQTASITDAQLRLEPFFRAKTFVSTDLEPALFGADGSQYAQEHRNTLLARAFPARTLPVGANAVTALGSQSNLDMNQLFKAGWPQSRRDSDSTDWRHSDMREVAYTYIYKMFDKIVTLGGLYQ